MGVGGVVAGRGSSESRVGSARSGRSGGGSEAVEGIANGAVEVGWGSARLRVGGGVGAVNAEGGG